jgi:molybdopterin-binding protein
MKLSARNVLKGKIKNIKRGPISSLVVLEITPKVQIVSTITAESAAALKLKKGQTAYAVIKASSVMVGVDE